MNVPNERSGVSRLQIYGPIGLLRLSLFYLATKIFYPKARLVRFPIEVRGKRYINFGRELTTGVRCRIEAYPFYSEKKIISFGENVEINDFVHIAAINSVSIGDNVLIAGKVYVSDIQHGTYSGNGSHNSPMEIPKLRKLSSKPVKIENNVWIGESVSVMPGVTIGEGAIIGANSVVSKNIPNYSIAVGNPAKVIKNYNFKKNMWESI